MKKIILLGASLNSGNKGINALTRGQIFLIFNKIGIDTEIEILSNTVDKEINNKINYNNNIINIKEYPIGGNKNILISFIKSIFHGKNEIITKIDNCDMVWDISEGDSFSDIYGIKRFFKHSILKLTTLNLKKKLIIMPQTLGPFKKKWVKYVAKKVINKADKVFVRDDISKDIISNQLGIKRKIIYIPDMAFYMIPNSKISIDKFINCRNKSIIGLNVNALLYSGGYDGKNMFGLKVNYKKLIDELIERILKIDNVELILIPHVITKEFEVEDDLRICQNIAKKLGTKLSRKIYSLDKEYREDEIKAIISGCDFFIGSRMHSCIGAISTKVPTVPLAYSRKFLGVWDKIGLGYCVLDLKSLEKSEVIENVMKNFNNRNEISKKLEVEIPLLKKKIEEIVDIINK